MSAERPTLLERVVSLEVEVQLLRNQAVEPSKDARLHAAATVTLRLLKQFYEDKRSGIESDPEMYDDYAEVTSSIPALEAALK